MSKCSKEWFEWVRNDRLLYDAADWFQLRLIKLTNWTSWGRHLHVKCSSAWWTQTKLSLNSTRAHKIGGSTSENVAQPSSRLRFSENDFYQIFCLAWIANGWTVGPPKSVQPSNEINRVNVIKNKKNRPSFSQSLQFLLPSPITHTHSQLPLHNKISAKL